VARYEPANWPGGPTCWWPGMSQLTGLEDPPLGGQV
jgi:hypothetical protein